MTAQPHTHRNAVIGHYEEIWGVRGKKTAFCAGPIHELPADFAVVEFPPHGERQMWTYATCCMSQPDDDQALELHMFSPISSLEPPEILTAVAHYHRTGVNLGVGHTVNFGKPWLGTSSCHYGLVSLPYLDGPALEQLSLPGNSIVRFLWLVPLTQSEVKFKKANGLDALEERLEEACFNYLDPNRPAVC